MNKGMAICCLSRWR